MKLWHCDNCGGYYNKAYLTVPMGATCQLEGDRAVFADPDFEPRSSWKLDELDFSDVECPDCNAPIETVEVDTCPHSWKTRETFRMCKFCGKTQRGRVTFPKA